MSEIQGSKQLVVYVCMWICLREGWRKVGEEWAIGSNAWRDGNAHARVPLLSFLKTLLKEILWDTT